MSLSKCVRDLVKYVCGFTEYVRDEADYSLLTSGRLNLYLMTD